jgi:DNA-binding NarL/FixJ family response regulator
MLKVIMFDDVRGYRESVKAFWKKSEDIFLAAEFDDANNAVAEVRRHQPDVVLMDIRMPGKSGINAMVSIKKVYPKTKVLILTAFPDDDKIFAALQLGASGFAYKEDVENLDKVIQDVYKYGGYLTPTVAARVASFFNDPSVRSQETYEELTKRETDVLTCMVKGKSRKMIADDLTLSLHTVNDHISRIYEKLHVNSATEAVIKAIELRLVKWQR